MMRMMSKPKCVIPAASVLVLTAFLLLAPCPAARAVWETVVDGASFNSPAAFQSAWAYDYPWGTDHNGSARMNPTNVVVSGGVVTLVSSLTNRSEGSSGLYPYLTIRYNSGTFYLKQPVTISPAYPVWDISGQFIAPTQTGTWPAFWMTGVNSWPPESDFMEFKGSTGCNQNTYDGSWQGEITPVSDAGSTWHTYRMVATLVDATNVDFHYFIDGVMMSEQTSGTFVGSPCWLIIDYQMEGSSGGPGPGYKTYLTIKNVIVRRENVAGVSSAPLASGVYKLLAQSTGGCLDVSGQSTATNSPLVQWPYNGGLNQQWRLTGLGGDQYSVFGRQSGRALGVINSSAANGAMGVIGDYTGAGSQHWQITITAGNHFELSNVNSGKVLEVSDASLLAGAPIDQWSPAAASLPRFLGIALSGTNVLLAGEGGVPGIGYSELSSSDPGYAQGGVRQTAMVVPDQQGDFMVTNEVLSPGSQQFFRLQLSSTNSAENQQWDAEAP